MIVKTTFKDRPAIAVTAGRLTATFLPEDGGKMASLVDEKGFEYFEQAPGESYLRLTPDGDFVSSECSAFDDMFPTIDPYTATEGAFAGIPYPDHGEIARIPSECTVTDEAVTFRFPSRLFKTVFVKTVTAENEGIRLSYHIENGYDEPYPCLWVAHCMLHGEEDAEVVTSYAPDAPIKKMFGRDEPEQFNRLSLAPFDPENGKAYKFYYTEPMPEGYCGYRYASTGRTLKMTFDETKIPYVGLWFNCGRFKGMYNVAMEIATGPYDAPDKAEAEGKGFFLPAGGAFDFDLTFSLEDN